MKRSLGPLASREFDIVVVGGGIYGACVAYEAALRGLSVALLEQEDFGWATSAHMHRILHGGFRYLRNFDVKRIWESVRERRTMMRLAPHLSSPLPVLVPTYTTGIQHRELMRAAIAMYDVLAWNRNEGILEERLRIPKGRIVSRDECLRLAPGLDPRGVTGGAIFYDGSLQDPFRLNLEFVRSAADAGACAANYVRVTDFLKAGGRVKGVAAVDCLTGDRFDVRGRVVINTCGPWMNSCWAMLGLQGPTKPMRYVRSVDVVTKPLTEGGHGLAFMGPQSGKPDSIIRYFIAPWRSFSVIGSVDYLHGADPDSFGATQQELEELVHATRRAMPGSAISLDDVVAVQAGLIPHEDSEPLDDPYNAARHYRILDHERRDGVAGVLSVVGIKYTTARDVAEKTVNLATAKLGKGTSPSLPVLRSLHCGDIDDLESFLAEAARRGEGGIGADAARQLAREYGTKYVDLLAAAAVDPSMATPLATRPQVLAVQVQHAVRAEMACRLADVVVRRTAMAADGHPGSATIRATADLMASLCGWDQTRTDQEIRVTEGYLRRFWTRARS